MRGCSWLAQKEYKFQFDGPHITRREFNFEDLIVLRGNLKTAKWILKNFS